MINPLKRIEVNHFVLHHPNVDARTSGLRVAHITDIHLGRWVKPRHVRDLARFVNGHEPDLTVLTGDYVGYSKRDIEPCAAALGQLEGPVYATLGNHDHWACTDTAHRAFDQSGIPLLSNASQKVETRRGHHLQVIGVDDAVTKNHDVDQAFGKIDCDHFRLVLCHVPELGPRVAEAGGDLILSGHTHGLQFNIPRVAEPLAGRFGMTYIQGAYTLEEQCVLYVSRGLGSASWPWRYRARPELTFFRLEQGDRPEMTLEKRTETGLALNTPRKRRRRRLGASKEHR